MMRLLTLLMTILQILVKKIASNIPSAPLKSIKCNYKSMFLYKTTEEEVLSIMNELDNKSSSGLDYLRNILIKISSDITAPFLCDLINQSLREVRFQRFSLKLKLFYFIKMVIKLMKIIIVLYLC